MDEDGVVVADVLLEAVEERAADAGEADDVRDGVGRDAVHAIDFQHGEVAVMPANILCHRAGSKILQLMVQK